MYCVLGFVSLQCSTSRSILRVEALQSERSEDNTCHLGNSLEQFGPKLTLATPPTLVTAFAMTPLIYGARTIIAPLPRVFLMSPHIVLTIFIIIFFHRFILVKLVDFQ